jgi:hypothetical protein
LPPAPKPRRDLLRGFFMGRHSPVGSTKPLVDSGRSHAGASFLLPSGAFIQSGTGVLRVISSTQPSAEGWLSPEDQREETAQRRVGGARISGLPHPAPVSALFARLEGNAEDHAADVEDRRDQGDPVQARHQVEDAADDREYWQPVVPDAPAADVGQRA